MIILLLFIIIIYDDDVFIENNTHKHTCESIIAEYCTQNITC